MAQDVAFNFFIFPAKAFQYLSFLRRERVWISVRDEVSCTERFRPIDCEQLNLWKALSLTSLEPVLRLEHRLTLIPKLAFQNVHPLYHASLAIPPSVAAWAFESGMIYRFKQLIRIIDRVGNSGRGQHQSDARSLGKMLYDIVFARVRCFKTMCLVQDEAGDVLLEKPSHDKHFFRPSIVCTAWQGSSTYNVDETSLSNIGLWAIYPRLHTVRDILCGARMFVDADKPRTCRFAAGLQFVMTSIIADLPAEIAGQL